MEVCTMNGIDANNNDNTYVIKDARLLEISVVPDPLLSEWQISLISNTGRVKSGEIDPNLKFIEWYKDELLANQITVEAWRNANADFDSYMKKIFDNINRDREASLQYEKLFVKPRVKVISKTILRLKKSYEELWDAYDKYVELGETVEKERRLGDSEGLTGLTDCTDDDEKR